MKMSAFANMILRELPTDILGLWFAIEDILTMLKEGGLSHISKE